MSGTLVARLRHAAGGFAPPGPNAAAMHVPSEFAAPMREAADEIQRLRGALAVIASGKVPPDKHGHYLAHQSAVRLARRTLGQDGSEAGDELAREGSASGMNPKGGPA